MAGGVALSEAREVLLKAEAVKTQQGFALLLQEIIEILGVSDFNVVDAGTFRLRAVSVIRACDEQWGGFAALIAAVRETDGPEFAGRLAAAIDVDRPQSSQVTLPQRRRLREILTGIQDTHPADCWRPALRSVLTLKQPPSGLLGAARQLDEAYFDPDGVTPPPLIAFVDALAGTRDLAPLRAAQLRAWSAELTGRPVGPPPTRPQRPDQAAAARVLLKIDEVGTTSRQHDGAAQFRLSAWLYSDGTVVDKIQRTEPVLGKHLAREGEALLHDIGRGLLSGGYGEVMVEFLLPWSQLGTPVESWRLRDASELALHCPVVVRSLDRLLFPYALPQWRRSWSSLPAGGETCWLHLHPPVPLDPADVVVGGADSDELHAILTTRDSEVVCVGFTFGYPACTDPPAAVRYDPMAAVVRAGVPIAVWRRDGGPMHEIRETLSLLQSARQLAELPRQVLHLRRQARAGTTGREHCGRHVALLYDDPTTTPEPLTDLALPGLEVPRT
ncbi:hypothetical protein AB0J72_45430 [Dactylosporangium sp. NPDC049742]|uniref:VMAP-C domain-containing protein n=1 Tax=Dactylosporangium sp. NPDC049742 TaxID=3154737 RepID=UPI003447EDF7